MQFSFNPVSSLKKNIKDRYSFESYRVQPILNHLQAKIIYHLISKAGSKRLRRSGLGLNDFLVKRKQSIGLFVQD
jgi:hypothetical protein